MWVRKTARVRGVILASTWSLSMPSVRGSISTNTGSKPQCKTAAMSETHVKGGTITSPPPCNAFKAARVSKFADDPEFTKTLYFVPIQADHSRSKARTLDD